MTFTRSAFMVAGAIAVLFSTVMYVSCKKEVPENPCKGIQCLNAGTCIAGKCSCPSGYTGTYCESVIDPCVAVSCQNGGTCNQGYCTCPTGTTGTLCETVYRSMYVNTYIGSGTDEDGNIYPNFRFKFTIVGSDLTKMLLMIQDNVGNVVVPDIPITLADFSATGSSFTITPHTVDDYTYTGSGTVSATVAAITLHEAHVSGGSTIFTFSNCTKF